MEYGSILQQAWDIAWRYKSLWVFGLFIESMGGLNGLFNPSDSDKIRSFTESPAFWTLVGIGVIIGIVFLIMHFISSAAHIDAVNKLTRGGTYSFGSSFSVGVDNFFRFVGLGLLGLGAVIALMVVLALPGILLFFIHWAIGVLGLIVLIPALFAGLATIMMLYWLSQRAVVARGSGISDALDEGYFLFRTYLGNCIKFALLLLLISIIAGLAILMIFAIVAAPFIAMAVGTEGGLIPALLIGIPTGLVLMLVIDGLFGSFFASAVTLFYFRLLDIPLEQQRPYGATGPIAV